MSRLPQHQKVEFEQKVGTATPTNPTEDYSGVSLENSMNDLVLEDEEHVSLCEALDRVLNKGAVVAGEITISVANVDLIYLGLQLVLKSIERCPDMGYRSVVEVAQGKNI